MTCAPLARIARAEHRASARMLARVFLDYVRARDVAADPELQRAVRIAEGLTSAGPDHRSRWRPARASVRSAPSGGAYVERPYPGAWDVRAGLDRLKHDDSAPGGVCDDPLRRGLSYWFDRAPAARKGYGS